MVKILIVEDNEMNRDMLSRRGCQPRFLPLRPGGGEGWGEVGQLRQ